MEDPLRRQEEPHEILNQLMEDALKQSLPTAAGKTVNEALEISRSEKRRNAKLAAQAQQGDQQQDDQHHYKNADKGKSKGKSSKGKGKKGKGKKGDQNHEERKNPVRLLPASGRQCEGLEWS